MSAKSVSHLGLSGFKRSVIEKDTWQLSSDWTNLCVLKDQLFGDVEEHSKNQVFFLFWGGGGVLFGKYCKIATTLALFGLWLIWKRLVTGVWRSKLVLWIHEMELNEIFEWRYGAMDPFGCPLMELQLTNCLTPEC